MTQSATIPAADDALRVVAGAPRAMFFTSASALPMLRGPMVAYAPEDDAGGGGGDDNGDDGLDDQDHEVDEDADDADAENDGEEGDDEGEGEDPLEDFEHDGKAYKIPQAVRQAISGYAQQVEGFTSARQTFEAQQQAHQREVELSSAVISEQVKVTALTEAVDFYEKLDWSALQSSDPEKAQKLWMEYQQTQLRLKDAAKTLDEKRTEVQKAVADQDAARIAETEAALAREIPNWGKPLFDELVGFAGKMGITQARLREADVGEWKLLHLASIGAKAQQQQAKVDRHKATQQTRPSAPVKGRSSAPRLTDKMSTEDWMKRRNAEAAKAAR